MTVMSKIGLPARCSHAEVEGFLLSSTNLKIKAEPSFFCPLTGNISLVGCTFAQALSPPPLPRNPLLLLSQPADQEDRVTSLRHAPLC